MTKPVMNKIKSAVKLKFASKKQREKAHMDHLDRRDQEREPSDVDDERERMAKDMAPKESTDTLDRLANKLLEFRGKRSGYSKGEAPARGSGALKKAVGDALSKSRYGVDKPAKVEKGTIQDPGERGGIDKEKRALAGKFAQRMGSKPGMPKLQSRKKEESTDVKGKIVHALREAFLGVSRDRMAAGAIRADKPWTRNTSGRALSKKAGALASVLNKQPSVVKARADRDKQAAIDRAEAKKRPAPPQVRTPYQGGMARGGEDEDRIFRGHR